MDELKKLLSEAVDLTEQLQIKLKQIDDFQAKVAKNHDGSQRLNTYKQGYVYFYYDDHRKVPMASGVGNDISSITKIDAQLESKLQRDFPKAFPDNLFVSVNGYEFKVNSNR